MVDVTEISAIVAAIGVLIGVALAVLELRDLVKTRKTDVVMRLHSEFTKKEMVEASVKFLGLQFKDYDDFQRKYGSILSGSQEVIVTMMNGMFFEGIGVLVHRGLVDIDLVRDLFSITLPWEKIKPIAEGLRSQFGEREIFEWYEYLYNEVKKREQRLKREGA
jgi:hypothetical protein